MLTKEIYTYVQNDHVAGIVLLNEPNIFNMPWHDCLMPIADNYLAVERSVVECAAAGCQTIWVVGKYGDSPLIRKRLGDYVVDPASLPKDLCNSMPRKVVKIPIFYVALKASHSERMNFAAWGALYTARTVTSISLEFSKWATPGMFYCTFPHGIVPINEIMNHRKLIASRKKVTFSVGEDHNVQRGKRCSFTFDNADMEVMKNEIHKLIFNEWKNNKDFSLADVGFKNIFSQLDPTHRAVVQLSWAYDVKGWEQYREFHASEHASLVKRIKYPLDLFVNDRRTIYVPRKIKKVLRDYESKDLTDEEILIEDPDS